MENISEIVSQRIIKHKKMFGVMLFVSRENLIAMHKKQSKRKAVGADGITKQEYTLSLEANIDNLKELMR